MILTPQEMLNSNRIAINSGETYFRNGIQLEKGATLSEKRIQKNLRLYQQYMDYFAQYPDLF